MRRPLEQTKARAVSAARSHARRPEICGNHRGAVTVATTERGVRAEPPLMNPGLRRASAAAVSTLAGLTLLVCVRPAAAQQDLGSVVCVASELESLSGAGPVRRVIRRDTEIVYRVGVDLSSQAEAERALRAELETSGEVSCAWSQPGQSHVVVVSYNGVVRQDLTIDLEDPRYKKFRGRVRHELGGSRQFAWRATTRSSLSNLDANERSRRYQDRTFLENQKERLRADRQRQYREVGSLFAGIWDGLRVLRNRGSAQFLVVGAIASVTAFILLFEVISLRSADRGGYVLSIMLVVVLMYILYYFTAQRSRANRHTAIAASVCSPANRVYSWACT